MPVRYLTLDTRWLGCSGLDHNAWNLQHFLAVGKMLDLISVLPFWRLEPRHNNGKALVSQLTEYFDLESLSQETTHEEPPGKEEVLVWTPNRERSPLSLLERDEFFRRVAAEKGEPVLEEIPYRASFCDLAEKYVGIMGRPLLTVHVRRTDYLDIRPGLRVTTSVANIRAKIAKALSTTRFRSVYLLTDEPHLGYFDELKQNGMLRARIYTLADFPPMVDLRNEDNYSLYVLERCIEKLADGRISTWRTDRPYYLDHLDNHEGSS